MEPYMALEKELETYKKLLPSLLKDEGKFVLISGNELADVFAAYEDAIKSGYKRYGTDTPFLVRKIQSMPEVHYITRLGIPTCPTSH